MKTKLSITVDEENVRQIDKFVEDGTFRNKSHAIEFAIVELLKAVMEEEKANEEQTNDVKQQVKIKLRERR